MDSRSPTKRKRALSTASTTYSATPSSSTIINPLSHPPSTLKQFLPAGNSPDAPLPSSIYPDFPHRPLPSSPTSSHPRSLSRSRSRRSSFASTTFNSDAGTEAGTDAETDAWTTTATDADTISVTSTGKPYAKRDPVRSTARLHKAHQSRVGALVAIIQRCLAEGDIALARRAFGLLVRADVNGRKVDLRFGGYWELGAEVLMRVGENQGNQLGGGSQGGLFGDGTQMEEEEREGVYDGEGPSGEGDAKERKERNRLLRAAQNRDRVRAYYETLIHLHPWSRLHPNKMGAVDFYPALFGFEMEACFAEHRYGVEQLDRQPLIDSIEDDDDDLHKFGGDDDDHMQIDQQSALHDPLRSSPPSPSIYYPQGNRGMDTDTIHPLYRTEMEEDERRSRRPEVRLKREKEKLRIKALEQMRDVARRMDAVLENTPYNKDVELVRLRAMVALYVGDLSVPVTVTQEVEGEEQGSGNWRKSHEERMNEEEGRRAQAAERDRARVLFIKMRELRGGELEEGDEWVLELISGGGGGDGDQEDEDFDIPKEVNNEILS
ncbi:hypothetical protein B0T13DRAFT_518560 [Neurospora crassa]|nr:hypothetical protein B0T13DRAFT_518560 [Neurospora crassa]